MQGKNRQKGETERGQKDEPSKWSSSPFGIGDEQEQDWTGMDAKRFLELDHLH